MVKEEDRVVVVKVEGVVEVAAKEEAAVEVGVKEEEVV